MGTSRATAWSAAVAIIRLSATVVRLWHAWLARTTASSGGERSRPCWASCSTCLANSMAARKSSWVVLLSIWGPDLADTVVLLQEAEQLLDLGTGVRVVLRIIHPVE